MASKLIKSKTPKIYKNKKLNNANFGNYNLNDYQVFLHLVSKLGKVDEFGKYQQCELLERNHVLTAQEFAKSFNIEPKHAYSVLKKATTKLMQSFITLEKPELFETWQIAICESAKYNHKNGSITILFTQSIMPYLAQVNQKFILYNLREIADFGSLYSTRLYELIQEFKDTGYLIKSVDQLREIFATGNKYKQYTDFRQRTFGHAVKEINDHYEINLKFEEIKNRLKVVAIKFSFLPTFTRKCVDPYTGESRNIYVKPKRKKKIKIQTVIDENQQELDLA